MIAPLSKLRRAMLMALGTSLLAASAAAQSPDDRAAIERFRDSLAGVTDSAAVLGLEREMIDLARADRNNAVLHIKLGFLALRLGELGGRRHYDDAASEFQWAIDLQPNWPYAWYGMGLAEYGVGDSQVSVVAGLKTMLGKDALTRSAMAFARSAEVDPGFVHGLVELANTALRQRVNIKLDVALAALRRASTTAAGAHPEVLLARGRVEREVGDVDSALAAFRGYLETGANPGLGRLELARTQFLQGSEDGLPLYYEGAAVDDPTVVAAYREDIELIATDSALAEFDAARGEERAAFLRRFWSRRDQVALRTPGERLREHYRRLFYARRNFALVSTNRHYDIVERYRSGSDEFDDRGIIYVRHGEPTNRARYTAPGVQPNESWLYTRPDGDLVFHFVAREDVQDYKLVESVFDVLGFSNALLLRSDTSALGDLTSSASQLLTSRESFSPVYSRLQSAGRASAGQYLSSERRLGRESIEIGTTTDSYELEFPSDLEARTEVVAVGREGGRPHVQVTYAIAGSSLQPVQISEGLLYSIRLRFVAIDSAGGVVASVDTTRHFVAAQPVPQGEHLVGRVAVPVAAGPLEYRIALQQGSAAGVVRPRDTVQVRPNRGSIGLSDLVLGRRSANLIWQRTARDTVFFNPLGTFNQADQIQLYYEVTGLGPGERYETKLEVEKEGGGGIFGWLFGGGSSISLEFEETAPGSVAPITRILPLDRLEPGTYVMEITVTDSDGRADRREREFEVVEADGER